MSGHFACREALHAWLTDPGSGAESRLAVMAGPTCLRRLAVYDPNARSVEHMVSTVVDERT